MYKSLLFSVQLSAAIPQHVLNDHCIRLRKQTIAHAVKVNDERTELGLPEFAVLPYVDITAKRDDSGELRLVVESGVIVV